METSTRIIDFHLKGCIAGQKCKNNISGSTPCPLLSQLMSSKAMVLTPKGGPRIPDFFTVNQLARHFGGNPKTIYRRLWAKGIPAFKIGRRWRIAKKDIIWLKR
jgi:excisionase family DNA binding protein